MFVLKLSNIQNDFYILYLYIFYRKILNSKIKKSMKHKTKTNYLIKNKQTYA